MSLLSTPPPPPSPIGGVGGHNHCDTGKEGEWRLPLLYANPLGHRVPAIFFIARVMRNDMSADHYEMIGKLSRPGGHCMGCVGVILHGHHGDSKKGVIFGPSRAKVFKGCQGQGLHLSTPHAFHNESRTTHATTTALYPATTTTTLYPATTTTTVSTAITLEIVSTFIPQEEYVSSHPSCLSILQSALS